MSYTELLMMNDREDWKQDVSTVLQKEAEQKAKLRERIK